MRRWSFEPITWSAKPHFANQIHRPWLGGQEAVGTGFEHAPCWTVVRITPPSCGCSFHQGGTHAGFIQVVGGGESGDAAADDEDLSD